LRLRVSGLGFVVWGGGPALRRDVKRFRGGLVFKVHRLLYDSTLGLRVIKKKRRTGAHEVEGRGGPAGRGVFFFFITLKPGVE